MKGILTEERWGVMNLLALIESSISLANGKYDFQIYQDRVDFVNNEIIKRIEDAEEIELPDGTTFKRSFEPSKRGSNPMESIQRKRRVTEMIAVDKSDPNNIETGVSNLFLKGAKFDTNGNQVIIVGFPNDRGFAIQTNGTLPQTHDILYRNGGRRANLSKLSDVDIQAIGREVTDYAREYGSPNIKSRLKTYSMGESKIKKEITMNTKKRVLAEATDGSFDVMLNAYLTAALWSSGDDNVDSFLSEYGIDDIDAASRNTAETECRKFIDTVKKAGLYEDYLSRYEDKGGEREAMSSMGHDFWLTRNGHGVGFWDRTELDDGDLGKKMTQIADAFKEKNVFLDTDTNTLYFE